MKKAIFLAMTLLFASSQLQATPPDNLKPRVIILTDLKRVHETDDAQSIVRLLSLADLVEIEGIIISSGFNYWKESHIMEGYELIWELLDAYGESVQNLMKMEGQKSFLLDENKQTIGYWPSLNYLKQRVAMGTPLSGFGEVGDQKGNDGSRLITRIVDEQDERPVYLLAWGGANVLAQALWDISENPLQKREAKGVQHFINKLKVLAIAEQDVKWTNRNNPYIPSNSHVWMRKKWPELFWVKLSPDPFASISNGYKNFYQAHIQGHGSIGNRYLDHSNSVEGDTPSLLYVLPLGINAPDHPEWGSLTGLYAKDPARQHTFYADDFEGQSEVKKLSRQYASRWMEFTWNLFAVRMDWAMAAGGNRPPVAIVNNDEGYEPLIIEEKAGEKISLDASLSHDRESDALTYHWDILKVPDAYQGKIEVGEQGKKMTFEIPEDAKGKQIHVLFELKDNGAGHHLTSFKRIVISVQ